MVRTVTFLATYLLASQLATAAGCETPPAETYLSLDSNSFDQTRGKGWREFDDAGCSRVAAEMILEYIRFHGHNGNMAFHAGQLFVETGDFERARPWFVKSLRRESTGTFKWNAFVEAYIAYIDRDRARLQAARDEIASEGEVRGNRSI